MSAFEDEVFCFRVTSSKIAFMCDNVLSNSTHQVPCAFKDEVGDLRIMASKIAVVCDNVLLRASHMPFIDESDVHDERRAAVYIPVRRACSHHDSSEPDRRVLDNNHSVTAGVAPQRTQTRQHEQHSSSHLAALQKQKPPHAPSDNIMIQPPPPDQFLSRDGMINITGTATRPFNLQPTKPSGPLPQLLPRPTTTTATATNAGTTHAPPTRRAREPPALEDVRRDQFADLDEVQDTLESGTKKHRSSSINSAANSTQPHDPMMHRHHHSTADPASSSSRRPVTPHHDDNRHSGSSTSRGNPPS